MLLAALSYLCERKGCADSDGRLSTKDGNGSLAVLLGHLVEFRPIGLGLLQALVVSLV